MTKSEMEKAIITEIKKSQIAEYGNYSIVDSIKQAISRAMFGKDMTSITIYEFGNGKGKGKHHTDSYRVQLITDEELAMVEKIYSGMVRNGYLRVSKSGEMAKLVKENN